MSEGRYDYRVASLGDNGEFLTWATLELLEDGVAVSVEVYNGTSEFPGEDAVTQAVSAGAAWVEAMSYTLEERLSREYEREQMERW